MPHAMPHGPRGRLHLVDADGHVTAARGDATPASCLLDSFFLDPGILLLAARGAPAIAPATDHARQAARRTRGTVVRS